MRRLLRELECTNSALRNLRRKRRLRMVRRVLVVTAFVVIGWLAAEVRAKGGDEEHYTVHAAGRSYSMLDLRYMTCLRSRRA